MLKYKQQAFVAEYLVDFNATAAYKRAGYKWTTEASAQAGASRLLSNVKVQAFIKEGLEKRKQRVELNAEYVLDMLRENLERAMQKVPVLDDDGKEVGKFRYNGAVANKALELLGKHLGLFPNKHELSGPSGGAIEVIEILRDKPKGALPDLSNRMSGTKENLSTTNGHESPNANGNGKHGGDGI